MQRVQHPFGRRRESAHGIGDLRHTAPAYGRDTIFVGDDRLWALDPTPGDSPAGGPAVRFGHEFAGRVGPGPIHDDGTLYAVAQVDAGRTRCWRSSDDRFRSAADVRDGSPKNPHELLQCMRYDGKY
ncbi:pyrrolo-quinoline quinone [Natrialba asiatica DSM 12278]|uniref:Pyrrolo-quinoline quinone n=1 Tax=Natrialba asiatica (strain ATCC 700177 / DSM 12278 / JCM 9576 / FERM P-10747 / NBRC 102637 / 172P1) TaxID=29540 RepID=M0AUN7_NATA1|nr:pyrrolo-quinoline quinone [Natrialba asiatica DSM 12278]